MSGMTAESYVHLKTNLVLYRVRCEVCKTTAPSNEQAALARKAATDAGFVGQRCPNCQDES